MKTKLIIATLGLASVLSFGASAAVQQVNADQAQNLQRMGSVSVTSVTGSPAHRLTDGYPSGTCRQS